MPDALHDILTRALELELAEPRKSFEERLNKCLSGWSGLKFCTFATAFEIQRNTIRVDPNDSNKQLIYCGLEEPKEPEKKTLYAFFTKLTKFPKRDAGRWPWNIIRDLEKGKTSGIFPPVNITIVNSLPNPIWADEDTLDRELINSFRTDSSDENSRNENSWKWYAEFPALLGDLIRPDSPESKHLVYILGTRREFVRDRSRDRDFGLIVGLTELEDVSLNQATNYILAAWNLVVVAEHIVEDAERIALLEAARSMSHTFRTFVESSTLPTIRTIIRAADVGTSVENEVAARVLEVGCLAAFMGFVARGGIRELSPRTIDIELEPYNPVQMIIEEFQQVAKEEENPINLTIGGKCTNGTNLRFANKLYIRSICHELIKNIQDHGKKEQDGKVTVNIDCASGNEHQGDEIRITIKNPFDPPDPPPEGAMDPTRGLESLKNMVDACGGKYENFPSKDKKDKDWWTTRLMFDLSLWKDKTAHISPSPPGLESIKASTPTSSDLEIKKGMPLESPALRLLLLDDELAYLKVAERSIINLSKPEDWIWYSVTIKDRTFFCFGHTRWQIELLLCNSVFHVRDQLIDQKFDICLIDVDFSKDPERGRKAIPSLGGILPALAFCKRPYTYLTIFTAKDSELRDDANYSFLREMAVAGYLGNLKVEDLDAKGSATKELSVIIPHAIIWWMNHILPNRYPDEQDASLLVDVFLEKNKPFDGSLKLKHPKERVVSLPHSLFGDLLTDSAEYGQQIEDIIRLLSKAACGHQLVRHTVCNIAHVNEDLPDCCVKALFEGIICHHNRFSEADAKAFTANIDAACKMFDVLRNDLMAVIGKPIRGAKVKQHTRMDIAHALSLPHPSDAVVFGIFVNPTNWMEEFKTQVEGLLKSKSSTDVEAPLELQLSIDVEDRDDKGNKAESGSEWSSRTRRIEICGQRKDNKYISESGGSYGKIVKLCKMASDVRLVGPIGALDMRNPTARLDTNDVNPGGVALRITVHHSRATEGRS